MADTLVPFFGLVAGALSGIIGTGRHLSGVATRTLHLLMAAQLRSLRQLNGNRSRISSNAMPAHVARHHAAVDVIRSIPAPDFTYAK